MQLQQTRTTQKATTKTVLLGTGAHRPWTDRGSSSNFIIVQYTNAVSFFCCYCCGILQASSVAVPLQVTITNALQTKYKSRHSVCAGRAGHCRSRVSSRALLAWHLSCDLMRCLFKLQPCFAAFRTVKAVRGRGKPHLDYCVQLPALWKHRAAEVLQVLPEDFSVKAWS
jgi:hypothetical protein